MLIDLKTKASEIEKKEVSFVKEWSGGRSGDFVFDVMVYNNGLQSLWPAVVTEQIWNYKSSEIKAY